MVGIRETDLVFFDSLSNAPFFNILRKISKSSSQLSWD